MDVIVSFRHKGIERFFVSGSKAGIQPRHATKLKDQLIDVAQYCETAGRDGYTRLAIS
jgi:plasmid maintenance system killer protein